MGSTTRTVRNLAFGAMVATMSAQPVDAVDCQDFCASAGVNGCWLFLDNCDVCRSHGCEIEGDGCDQACFACDGATSWTCEPV